MKSHLCECGHKNPLGTEICESCGKPLTENGSKEALLNMRYEGASRRSITYRKNVVDKVWNFFSSVKVGVWLIVIILIASAVGTIFPQQMYIPSNVDPLQFYYEQYGILGYFYFKLGFQNLYSSWWYLILLALLGLSLIIASIDRVIPLYRSLKNQKVTKHAGFLKRQRIFGRTSVVNHPKVIMKIKENLVKKRYKIREENGNLLAEKGRFSRWGPYVNHLGLVIFLIGGLLRFYPGMYLDETLWIRDGETKVIPGTEGKYYLKNNKFILETYEGEKYKVAVERVGGVAQNYQTNITLYENTNLGVIGSDPKLEKVKSDKIKVNHPIKVENLSLYQVAYQLDEMYKLSLTLNEKTTGKSFGRINVNLMNPKKNYELGKGYKIEMMEYFPDFEFSKEGPTTKSKLPNNPAFVFKMFTPKTPKGEINFIGIGRNMEPVGENLFEMKFAGVQTRNITALTIRKDHTLGILAIGGLIFMIGVVQGLYWNHRRIWIQVVDGEIWLSGHTNKNWSSLKKDIMSGIEGTDLTVPKDQKEGDLIC